MKTSYDGIVSVPHAEYEVFRQKLEQIPVNKRERRFRASISDIFGAKATVFYDEKNDVFYEKASKRRVVDRTTFLPNKKIPLTDLGAAVTDDEVHEIMARMQLQNRSSKKRTKHLNIRVPGKSTVNAY